MGAQAATALAESQHGIIARYQLVALGLDRFAIGRLRHSAGWEPVGRDLFRRTGAPRTASQRLSAAVLEVGAGAFLSHESAAAWWGHKGCRLESPIHVTTTQWRSRKPALAKRHQVRVVLPDWVTTLDGIATARPELVALNLFATMSYRRAERIAESMWSNRLFSGHSIGRFLSDLGQRGRNGTAGLRRYHAERGDEYVPSDSGLESRTVELLGNAGIRVRKQVNVGGAGAWTGRVDFLHTELPLVVEVQSALHHSSLVDWRADRARMEQLGKDGFVVVEVRDSQVWTDPASVVRAVRQGENQARSVL